jgi:hypothetical protein
MASRIAGERLKTLVQKAEYLGFVDLTRGQLDDFRNKHEIHDQQILEALNLKDYADEEN